MGIVKIQKNNYEEVIYKAVKIIQDGGIIIYPTETFYGIGARYDDEKAIKRIYELKKRDDIKTMPLIIGSPAQLDMIALTISPLEQKLIKLFWPGPLTILLEAKKNLSEKIVSNGKVAVRIPDYKFAIDISKLSNLPITSTSANISNLPPSNSVEPLISCFIDKVDLIIDAGLTKGGKASTIVDVVDNKIRILRDGAIVRSELDRLGLQIICHNT